VRELRSDISDSRPHTCDRYGILLVCDEVQCGVGRTGRMWACEYEGIEPDILLSAKGLGSGMPIGAIIAKESIMKWQPGAHGTTFGGNPVCCAAALATLDIVEKDLLPNVNKMGERLINGARELQKKYAVIGDVRGRGLMVGVEFVKDRATREPAPEIPARARRKCVQEGAAAARLRQELAAARAATRRRRVRRGHRPPESSTSACARCRTSVKAMSMQDAVARFVRDGDVVVIEGFTTSSRSPRGTRSSASGAATSRCAASRPI